MLSRYTVFECEKLEKLEGFLKKADDSTLRDTQRLFYVDQAREILLQPRAYAPSEILADLARSLPVKEAVEAVMSFRGYDVTVEDNPPYVACKIDRRLCGPGELRAVLVPGHVYWDEEPIGPSGGYFFRSNCHATDGFVKERDKHTNMWSNCCIPMRHSKHLVSIGLEPAAGFGGEADCARLSKEVYELDLVLGGVPYLKIEKIRPGQLIELKGLRTWPVKIENGLDIPEERPSKILDGPVQLVGLENFDVRVRGAHARLRVNLHGPLYRPWCGGEGDVEPLPLEE